MYYILQYVQLDVIQDLIHHIHGIVIYISYYECVCVCVCVGLVAQSV